ncbi:MAG: TonB family protein [Planctomycetota bacterium]
MRPGTNTQRRLRARRDLGITPGSLALALLIEAGAFALANQLQPRSIFEPEAFAEARQQDASIAFVESEPAISIAEEPPELLADPEPGELGEPPLLEYPDPAPQDRVEEPDTREDEPREEAWIERIGRRAGCDTPSVAREATREKLLPIAGLNPEPPYPARAVELGQEGSLSLALDVDARGRVVSIRVLDSTCSKLLALSAIKTLETWRFRGGPGIYRKTVHFRLLAGKPR